MADYPWQRPEPPIQLLACSLCGTWVEPDRYPTHFSRCALESGHYE